MPEMMPKPMPELTRFPYDPSCLGFFRDRLVSRFKEMVPLLPEEGRGKGGGAALKGKGGGAALETKRKIDVSAISSL